MQSSDSGNSNPASSTPKHDPFSAIRQGNFRLYWSGNLLAIVGMQMQGAAVSWEIYQRTDSKMALGWVGFVQVVPVLSFALLAGHVADRFDRKVVLMIALATSGLASLGLAVTSFFQWPILAMYLCLFFLGSARAFLQPAKNSFLPQLVPRALFSNAVTWSLGGFQLASIAGPVLCGSILAWLGRPYIVYLIEATAAVLFSALLMLVRRRGSAAVQGHDS